MFIFLVHLQCCRRKFFSLGLAYTTCFITPLLAPIPACYFSPTYTCCLAMFITVKVHLLGLSSFCLCIACPYCACLAWLQASSDAFCCILGHFHAVHGISLLFGAVFPHILLLKFHQYDCISFLPCFISFLHRLGLRAREHAFRVTSISAIGILCECD